ncbi:MAG: ribosome biogenesis/translation initiation ATPase RLI [Candidatus Methanomethylophilus sp.]|jgi:ATP-binding cassette subfamily E protein 1|nr:ribosome biogenesis/translation initiation ATPase RLI [Methanomethylophilus sp.]MCI2074350.1 ribosome biogenesis/translation initiation ATPase RLI [Methanomethylophilus sp.]MCI2092853.1 ribosome biogenesis/translation initiation ATPase RLI [Methanomethylophilus sp.]
MRIAAVLFDRCQNKKCNKECYKFCPLVRTGVNVIEFGERGKPIISESLCQGCGICANKCMFKAIKIIGLADELKGEMVHQYGENTFRLYRLPVPKKGLITGILGPNGIGKTTAINILSGIVIPNLGKYDAPPTKEEVLLRYKGTEVYAYLSELYAGHIKMAMKPQYVDKIPKVAKGVVRDLLSKCQERMDIDQAVKEFGLEQVIDRDITKLSGGELQRVAMATTCMKSADIYFFDEPTSYLDIYQRVKMARIIKKLATEDKYVVVIEHDLAILDYLADNVNLVYGSEGAYGVFTMPRQVRTAINVYLEGYLPEENIRFRDKPIEFAVSAPSGDWNTPALIDFENVSKDFGEFRLDVNSGAVRIGESVGVVGPNATGKTTFVKMLAGEIKPDTGSVSGVMKVSYKPQYISQDYDGTVQDYLYAVNYEQASSGFFETQVIGPLSLKFLMDKPVRNLSGGELQRVAIAGCLAREADIYLLDEPSAYLDSNQRMEAAKCISGMMEKTGRSALIVDHDIYFIDMVSDSLMVFGGEPGKHGIAEGPFKMREGMNRFLKSVDITFRRDADTHRPRINKEGSNLDRSQKSAGEYYYAEQN